MIPKIKSDVVNVFNRELTNAGGAYLDQELARLRKKQPSLYKELQQVAAIMVSRYDKEAGEATLKTGMLVYRLIEIQLEVNTMEEQSSN